MSNSPPLNTFNAAAKSGGFAELAASAKLSPESSGTFSDLQGENAETRSTFKTFSSPLASATTTVTNGDPSPQEISSSKKRSLADDDAVDVEDILGQICSKMNTLSTNDSKDDMIVAFISVLNCSHSEAIFFLDSAAWNVETAVHLWLESMTPQLTGSSGKGGGGYSDYSKRYRRSAEFDGDSASTYSYNRGYSPSSTEAVDSVSVGTGMGMGMGKQAQGHGHGRGYGRDSSLFVERVVNIEGLPAGWTARVSRSTGRIYFAHTSTGHTQFVVPPGFADAAPTEDNAMAMDSAGSRDPASRGYDDENDAEENDENRPPATFDRDPSHGRSRGEGYLDTDSATGLSHSDTAMESAGDGDSSEDCGSRVGEPSASAAGSGGKHYSSSSTASASASAHSSSTSTSASASPNASSYSYGGVGLRSSSLAAYSSHGASAADSRDDGTMLYSGDSVAAGTGIRVTGINLPDGETVPLHYGGSGGSGGSGGGYHNSSKGQLGRTRREDGLSCGSFGSLVAEDGIMVAPEGETETETEEGAAGMINDSDVIAGGLGGLGTRLGFVSGARHSVSAESDDGRAAGAVSASGLGLGSGEGPLTVGLDSWTAEASSTFRGNARGSGVGSERSDYAATTQCGSENMDDDL